jgi:Flp pilus assembly pilin Flp
MVIVIAVVIMAALVIMGAHRLVESINSEFDNINGKVD